MHKKIIAGIAAVFIVFASAFTMTGCYEKVEKIANEQASESRIQTVVQQLYYSANLDTIIYALNGQLEGLTADEMISIEGSDSYVEQSRLVFNEQYYRFWNDHIYDDANLHYYAEDLISGKQLSNSKLLTGQKITECLETYQAVIEVVYDEEGKCTVRYDSAYAGSLLDHYSWAALFNQIRNEEISAYISRDAKMLAYGQTESGNETAEIIIENETIEDSLRLKPITQKRIVFAVPKQLEKTGNLYYSSNWTVRREYQMNAVFYGAALAFIVFAVSLFFPIGTVKEWRWFKGISKIKFEILALSLGCLIVAAAAGGVQLCLITLSGDLRDIIIHFQLESYLNELTYLLNFIVWAVFFFLLEITAWMIRFIFNIGLWTYLKTHSCVFWVFGLFGAIARSIRNLVDRILTFDFQDPIHQIVLKIVIINFLFLSVLSCFFVFGILFGVVYSIVLFFFLRRKLKSIQEDYLLLLDALKKIASGNFNVTISQDVGVFNSHRDALADLKEGFEKAVNEEVKSQRLKTELISNVSHDLKTPLTSIISYVDLLKKEGISEEERKAYIDTIDRNSQRLKNLIADLFEISKANSGNVSLHLQEVELLSLIRQVIFECQEKIEEVSLDFRVSTNSDKILLHLDSLKTYRIFENLITNIIKYAMPHTRVYLDIFDELEQTVVTVKNISANELTVDVSEITERFVQGDKSRNTEGSGLGLAIVKSFTQLQNGEFHVEVDGDLFKAVVKFNK